MTWAKPNDVEQVASAEIECAFCLAPPGRWCSTRLGATAEYLHSARTRALYGLWSRSYHEAGNDLARLSDETLMRQITYLRERLAKESQ